MPPLFMYSFYIAWVTSPFSRNNAVVRIQWRTSAICHTSLRLAGLFAFTSLYTVKATRLLPA